MLALRSSRCGNVGRARLVGWTLSRTADEARDNFRDPARHAIGRQRTGVLGDPPPRRVGVVGPPQGGERFGELSEVGQWLGPRITCEDLAETLRQESTDWSPLRET